MLSLILIICLTPPSTLSKIISVLELVPEYTSLLSISSTLSKVSEFGIPITISPLSLFSNFTFLSFKLNLIFKLF